MSQTPSKKEILLKYATRRRTFNYVLSQFFFYALFAQGIMTLILLHQKVEMKINDSMANMLGILFVHWLSSTSVEIYDRAIKKLKDTPDEEVNKDEYYFKL